MNAIVRVPTRGCLRLCPWSDTITSSNSQRPSSLSRGPRSTNTLSSVCAAPSSPESGWTMRPGSRSVPRPLVVALGVERRPLVVGVAPVVPPPLRRGPRDTSSRALVRACGRHVSRGRTTPRRRPGEERRRVVVTDDLTAVEHRRRPVEDGIAGVLGRPCRREFRYPIPPVASPNQPHARERLYVRLSGTSGSVSRCRVRGLHRDAGNRYSQ